MLVANGFFEESIRKHHNKDVPDGLGVVSLVDILFENAMLPIPEPSCRLLKGAKGMILLWPRRLIRVESLGEEEPTNLCPPPLVKGKRVFPIAPNPTSKDVDIEKMPPSIQLLFQKLSGHNTLGTYNFASPPPILGVGKLITLCWVDFEDMWRMDMVTETLMSLYQR